MTDHNSKGITTDFLKGMEDFNHALNEMQTQKEIDAKTVEDLTDAQKRTVTAGRAYLNDLDVDPKILGLLSSLMNDPDALNDSKKIIEFEKNFKNLVGDIRKKLNSGNEDELLHQFPALNDTKSIAAAEIKLEAIAKSFATQASKSRQ